MIGIIGKEMRRYLSVTALKKISSGENLTEYKNFHRFLFKYHLLTPGQKVLDQATAATLIKLSLVKIHPIAEKFVEFLKSADKKAINHDQWANMLEVFPILEHKEHYDDNGACNIDCIFV